MKNESFYALVQGKYYKGDIEGKRYHWTKGIPGSKQLVQDLEDGKEVRFIYYRTWDKETKRGKYFYGTGVIDNNSLERKQVLEGQVEYYGEIVKYENFSVPVTVDKELWQKIWPGANRQPGIKKISETTFTEVIRLGLKPDNINKLTSVLGERDVEDLLNGEITPSDIKDHEAQSAAKRAVRSEIYKRSQTVIRKLKKKYKGLCQISGELLTSSKDYGVDVTEAHHINFLSKGGLDGDPANIIVISPEWHRLIHKENPMFSPENNSFTFSNGKELVIKYPGHLKK